MSRTAQSWIAPSVSCVKHCLATLLPQRQRRTQPEATCVPGMPSWTRSEAVWGMNPHSATHSSVTLGLLLLSLGLGFSSIKQILGSTLQDEWLQELNKTTVREAQRGPVAAWSHAAREWKRCRGSCFSATNSPPTPACFQPLLSRGPELRPASCWRPGLCSLAAALHDLGNRPWACLGLGLAPTVVPLA